MYFFFNDTATTEIYTLSLHDALPICHLRNEIVRHPLGPRSSLRWVERVPDAASDDRTHVQSHRETISALQARNTRRQRSEEHTSELQSRQYLVCRLLLEKKKSY